ncbi:DLA class I histocompatibility antigen, A9/A9 alpha chain-like isoform X1 [Tachysurus ichikawai]
MEDSRPILKVLSFLTFAPHVSSTDTHSLHFFYTAVTPGINVTAVGLLDGEQFVYYNSSIKKMIPKTEWIQKISTDDKDYWDRETERVEDNQDSVATVMKSLNQTEGETRGFNH